MDEQFQTMAPSVGVHKLLRYLIISLYIGFMFWCAMHVTQSSAPENFAATITSIKFPETIDLGQRNINCLVEIQNTGTKPWVASDAIGVGIKSLFANTILIDDLNPTSLMIRPYNHDSSDPPTGIPVQYDKKPSIIQNTFMLDERVAPGSTWHIQFSIRVPTITNTYRFVLRMKRGSEWFGADRGVLFKVQ